MLARLATAPAGPGSAPDSVRASRISVVRASRPSRDGSITRVRARPALSSPAYRSAMAAKRVERSAFSIICPPLRSSARSEEHTSELQSLMRISYAVFCLKKKKRHDEDYTRTGPLLSQKYNDYHLHLIN